MTKLVYIGAVISMFVLVVYTAAAVCAALETSPHPQAGCAGRNPIAIHQH